MSAFHNQVRLFGYDFKDEQFPVKLSGSPTTADIGKAVTQDTTAANTMKLAGDGDQIMGVLLTVENRTVEGTVIGTVSFEMATKLPIKAGLTGAAVVAIGSRLCGAGAGEVKAIDISGTPSAATIAKYAEAPVCWEVIGSKAVAVSQ